MKLLLNGHHRRCGLVLTCYRPRRSKNECITNHQVFYNHIIACTGMDVGASSSTGAGVAVGGPYSERILTSFPQQPSTDNSFLARDWNIMIHGGGIGKKRMDAGLDQNTLFACMEFSNNKKK